LKFGQLLASFSDEGEIGFAGFVQCQTVIVQKPLRMLTVLRVRHAATGGRAALSGRRARQRLVNAARQPRFKE